MAFDPVRDAILNSPERTSYIDPFDGPELGDQVAGTTTSKGSSFKAPERISTSRNGGSSSPDRLFSHGYATVETPGALTVPPTPGTSTSEDGRPNTAGGQRTSSIFSLLSPEPPADDSEELQSSNHNGYFDSFQRADSPQAYDQPLPTTSKQMYHEPDLARQKPSSSQFDSREGLKASLTVETTNGDRSGSSRPTSSSSSGGPRHQQRPSGRPAVKEPVKRGRPYAPYRRQGPPPPSLHIPITPEELAFYRNPANCKNPLREGVQVSGRSPPPIRESLRNDMKGKARAPTAPPEDVDIAPQYIEPSPLPLALQPGPVARGRPSLARNSSGSASPKKRKRDSFAASAVTGEGSQVAAFYNKRLNFSREQRNFSPIIGLKSFNNWVKSVLIAKYARDYHSAPEELQQGLNEHGRRGGARRQKPFRVLDIGCGKGGDLQKWQKAGITDYVAIDIAEVSIQQARRRWEELRGRRFDAKFYALDAYSNPLTAIIPESILTQPPFDVVTMQFCMHYAFQSVSKARMMLENVSRYLKPGGTFIGTIPDSEQLLTRLKELPEDAPLAFGNEVYRIAFDDRSKFPAFGHRYTFYLTDAVEDVPEYVVQWGAFETLAAEYNLKLLYHATFHELFSAERETPEFEQLLVRMKVVTPEGESELTEDQWEAANIYVAFAFVKI